MRKQRRRSASVFASPIVLFLFFLNPKFPVSSHFLCSHSSVCFRFGRDSFFSDGHFLRSKTFAHHMQFNHLSFGFFKKKLTESFHERYDV